MHRTTIMFPEKLKARAEQKARSLGVSLGEFLRVAAEEFIDKDERKWIEDPLVSGEYHIHAAAPLSVAENVDHYIYGKKK